MAKNYRILFSGDILPGKDSDQVRADVGKLFGFAADNPDHQAKLDKLFSGRTVVIKQNLDERGAHNYQQAMTKAGAIALVDQIEIKQEKSTGPGGVERRKHARRIKERRETARPHNTFPDRRKSKGRRQNDAPSDD